MVQSARSRRGSRTLWSLAATVLLGSALGACEAAGSEQGAGLVRPTASRATPAPLERLKQLDLVRAGTILAEQSARGVAEPAEFRTDGSFAFRATCSGGGKITVKTHGGGNSDISIRCDGFTSGMRYLTESDVEVWSVHATDDQRWSIVWVDEA